MRDELENLFVHKVDAAALQLNTTSAVDRGRAAVKNRQAAAVQHSGTTQKGNPTEHCIAAHTVAPASSENFPVGHNEHSAAPLMAAKRPDRHGVHSEAPVDAA